VVSSRLLYVETAAALAQARPGYDAVHCASAEQINDEDVVAARGRPLLEERVLPQPQEDVWTQLVEEGRAGGDVPTGRLC
jgi:hypothetical protein